MADLFCKRLAVSLVIHHWREEEVGRSVTTLGRSLLAARESGLLDEAALFILYNGSEPVNLQAQVAILARTFPFGIDAFQAQENGGYGKANNLLLEKIASRAFDTTLIMNPDVIVSEMAMPRLLWRLSGDPGCGIIVPRLLDPEAGYDVYGCKRYPSLSVLAVRQFPFLQRFRVLRRLNDLYEYRDRLPEWEHRGVELCSGCFMLARTDFWVSLGGFDTRYFMYFEDFDLSVRATKMGWVQVYEPGAIVQHAGGGVSGKSLEHRWWFVCSAFKFFRRHGWRLFRVGKGL
ncbi:glycosyltransferase [Marinobacter sp. NFXS9]|uniref:glycosyltransferase n=1 Tax=Marinobacter sp. NFXS9 TaxID=2818433 RepID=UPI0032E01395